MASKDNPDWPFQYPNDPLTKAMAAAARRAPGGLDKTFQRSATVVRDRRQRAVNDNTQTTGGNNMPTVKTQQEKKAPAKRSTRKASPVTTAVVREFDTDPKKAETPGAFRYKESHDEPLIVSLYMRKAETEKLFGQRPKGVRVTIEPIF
jgi:hypothetical protein